MSLAALRRLPVITLFAYVEGLLAVTGHTDRTVLLHDYCLGLLLPEERKSVERMAAATAPSGRKTPAPASAAAPPKSPSIVLADAPTGC